MKKSPMCLSPGRLPGIVLVALAGLCFWMEASRGQGAADPESARPRAMDSGRAVDSGRADLEEVVSVPFGPGERLGYQVKAGFLGGAGRGTMEVVGIEDVRGHRTYRLRFGIKGGVAFAKVDTKLQSWLDLSTLFARRFEQDQKEVRYKRHRVIDFFPERGRWETADGKTGGELASPMPLDDVSFIYFVRTLPLEIGQTYTLDRYYSAAGNPVIIKVLRKETVKVPLGTFNTIVVRPIIRTGGLFGEGGEAELYFTDDNRRLLVQMRSKVPVLGHLSLALDSYEPGRRLVADQSNVAGDGAWGR